MKLSSIKHPYIKTQIYNLRLDQLTEWDNISIQLSGCNRSTWINISKSALEKIVKIIDKDMTEVKIDD